MSTPLNLPRKNGLKTIFANCEEIERMVVQFQDVYTPELEVDEKACLDALFSAVRCVLSTVRRPNVSSSV